MPRITGKLEQAAVGIPIVDGKDVANVAPEFATLAALRAAPLETRSVYANNKRWLWNGSSTATDDTTEEATAVQRTGVPNGRYLPNPAQAAISVLTPSGATVAGSRIVGHGAAAVSGTDIDLTPTVGTPYDADIAAGAGATTLVTCPITAARRQTIGVDWSVYNSVDTLAGYQTLVAQRVGSAAPTILGSSFDPSTVQTEPAWSPRAEVSGNNILIRITADTENAVRAKVRAELLQSIDISDAPTAAVSELITLLSGLNGLWWRAADAVDAGGGLAGTVPDAVANANTITFSTSAGHSRPAISTLIDGTTPALTLSGVQVATAASGPGSQTSHTFIIVNTHVAPSGSIGPYLWGGATSGVTNIVAGHYPAPGPVGPGLFETDAWLTSVAGQPAADVLQCLEFSLDDAANVARIYRAGVQIGADGTYSRSTTLTSLTLFGCTDTTTFSARGQVTDVIYIPSALSAGNRTTLNALLRILHPVLP